MINETERKKYKFPQSHPWLTFELDLQTAPRELWQILGEVSSKCGHLSHAPLKPRVADELHQVYFAKGVHATAAIEGNTLSEDEVGLRIKGRLELPQSKEYLQVEVDNAIKALSHVTLQILENPDKTALSTREIMILNKMILDSLDLDDWVVPGEIHLKNVGVGRYAGPRSEECEYLLDKMCEWLNQPAFTPGGEDRIPFGVIRAILAHLYLVWIHPFGDGNGRTARAIELKILIGAGFPTPAAHLLSNHYNQTRSEYYRYLDAASREKSGLIGFLLYAVRGLRDGLRSQVKVIWDQQYDIAWRDFVYDCFRDAEGKTDKRLLQLTLAISDSPAPVPGKQIINLNAKIAREYALLSPRAPERDLGQLMRDKLIRRNKDGYVANREIILGFRPAISSIRDPE